MGRHAVKIRRDAAKVVAVLGPKFYVVRNLITESATDLFSPLSNAGPEPILIVEPTTPAEYMEFIVDLIIGHDHPAVPAINFVVVSSAREQIFRTEHEVRRRAPSRGGDQHIHGAGVVSDQVRPLPVERH